MHSLILVMSLMGSTILLVYLLFKPLLIKHFPLEIRIELLKLSLAFFIIPFPHYKYYIYDIWCFFTHNYFLAPKGDYQIVTEVIEVLPNGRIILYGISNFVIAVTVLYLVITIIKAITNAVSYKKLKKAILSSSETCTDKGLLDMVEKERQAHGIKRKIDIVLSDIYPISTLGIKRPVIILPTKPSQSTYYAVKHETSHIYTKDFIMQALLQTAKILHWFNPLVYILSAEMNRLLEFRADKNVIKDMTADDINAYGTAVIEAAAAKLPNNAILMTHFGSRKKITADRVKEMKQNKKFTRRHFVAGGLAICVLALVNTALVFAYKTYPIETYENSDITYSELESADMIVIGDCDIFDVPLDDFSKGDVIIEDENGNIIEPTETDEETEKGCSHTYINSTKTEHTLNGSGGCTVEKHNIQYCTKCGKTVKGSLISTTTYNPCPH